jgi:site-specific DNA recombinase
MPNTNGHGLKRSVLWSILYARVSTDEQARSGYSLAQQLEALRAYADREGYEVLEEVVDPGVSGASLERPGMDRVRDLVAAGGVSVVLAQDRDRFAREPAYHYLLRREFEEHGTKIRALNDRGGDSPEGDLTDGILDQLAKYERAKMAERSRRGKLRKAREGKVIAGRMARYGSANYGFALNDARDGLIVDEEKMAVVRLIFRMVGVEGQPINAAKRTLDAAGVPTATGKPTWSVSTLRDIISNDVYRSHSFEEVESLISPEVAARLDPQQCYGLWKWGTTRHIRSQVSEVGPDGTRVYRTQHKSMVRPEEEWVYVPVPDSGVPREWVDSARDAIRDNRRHSNAGRRFWELSGGILRCGECGRAMHPHTTTARTNKRFFYYCCKAKYKKGAHFCMASRSHHAESLEALVWSEVRAYLQKPEILRADLDHMIDMKKSGARGEPEREMRLWAERLAEADSKRVRFQHAYAEGIIGLDDLKARLAELDDIRTTAEQEIAALDGHLEHIRSLEQDRDAVLANLEAIAPETLNCLDAEERHRFYKMLRLRVRLWPDRTLEVTGAFPEPLTVGPEVCTLNGSRS